MFDLKTKGVALIILDIVSLDYRILYSRSTRFIQPINTDGISPSICTFIRPICPNLIVMDASLSQIRAISHRTVKFFINIFSYRLSPTHELNVRNT